MLINATELYKTINGVMYLNVSALLDSGVLTQLLAENSKITEVAAAVAGTKYSLLLEDNLKQLIITTEDNIDIQYSFDETEFDAGTTITVIEGNSIALAALNFIGKTLYFSTTKNSSAINVQQLY